MFKGVEKRELKVPAHIDYLGDLRDFITQIGRRNKFSDKVVNAFKLSIDEAATNIIRHAYRDSEGMITIRAVVKKSSLTLSIIDQGMYFDPKRVKDPDLNRYIDIGKKGGLGIFIMRKLMDEIDYRKTEEGNELRITKYRDQPNRLSVMESVSTIPFSIKAKFFFRAVGIITLIVAAGYLYFFFKTDDQFRSDFLGASRSTSRLIVNGISSSLDSPDDFSILGLVEIIGPLEAEYIKKLGIVHKIVVEDSAGLIAYSTNVSENLGMFQRPEGYFNADDQVYKYAINRKGEPFYEIETNLSVPVEDRFSGKKIQLNGKTHIFFSGKSLEKEIVAARLNILQLTLIILAVSYVGIALLIYLVMNPFRKLSEWIKTLGQGEEFEDEVDIDASSEIGEIARAFSDIQTKFRKSQRNLADQERLQKEMQVAKEIQQTLLPTDFPELEGYQLAAFYEAAKEVGGDYYDFVEVDQDTVGIAVADVSGKGVPGSLVMTMIRTALRTEARGVKDAAEVLAKVNEFVSNDIKKGMFVTVFYLIIDSKKRRLNYASAGHNPMILYRGSTKQTYYLNPKGFPIGVQLPDKNYFRRYIESDTIQLTRDDILLLYTDGITEAMNSRRELYGEGRLQTVLMDYGNLPVAQFSDRLKDSIYAFTEGAAQYDDITLVAVKEESTREEDELRRAKEVYQMISEGSTIRDACQKSNLTTYAYTNKYRKIFNEQGIDAFELDEAIAVEAKHLSIEQKTKIFDIVQRSPEFGAARIREVLNTEEYSFLELPESKIYDELVRSRLNTRALREGYVAKAKRNKRRLKPPGTPFMSLDGKIILKQPDLPDFGLDLPPKKEIAEPEKANEVIQSDVTLDMGEGGIEKEAAEVESVFAEFDTEDLLNAPLEELLASDQVEMLENPDDSETEAELSTDTEVEFSTEFESEGDYDLAVLETEVSSESQTDENIIPDFPETVEGDSLLEDFTFEELFEFEGAADDIEDGLNGISEAETNDKTLDSVAVSADEEMVKEEVWADEKNDVDDFESDKITKTVEVDISSQETSDEYEVGDEVSLTASVEELLDERETEDIDDDNDDFVDSSDVVEVEKNSEPEDATQYIELDKDTVSFSSLIQSFDDEIVYFTDMEDNLSNGSDKELENNLTREFVEEPHESSDIEVSNGAKVNGVEQTGVAHEDNVDRETVLFDGIKFYKEHDYDQAIHELKKVILSFPDYKEAHSILGNAYFRNKMFNEAAIEYQRVKEIDPKDITAYENMGVIHANRGEYRQAVGEWKKVIELSPNRTDIEDKIRKALRLI